ncbi:phage baseplate plug family protein [Leptospira stimsonii]|uniref:Cyanophage baseplate Pam3 plug gp18 domain-containing protein n=1 Tax=Leptospira stimsonii TaxID=2202203 RepID=A0ABY2N134_9LEPT|nr:hypothetical protein [Leptospira stimsonii]TGK19776.1 hypothetical protein EHO98_10870 [Leptospira stimsonii]TGM13774.1 hypothetical protein EHQ90_13265 [Leptospira stimsonii]
MPIFKYIPVDPESIPIRNIYQIGSKDYEFEFAYNQIGDFITVIIRNQDDVVLFSSCLIYGISLNHVVVDDFPVSISLKPFDIDDLYREEFIQIPVNRQTFGSTVQIYLEGEE